MLKTNEFFETLNSLAPLRLSHKMIEKGDYDNSGILVYHHENVERVLFSLDLSAEAVSLSKKLKADTIVTHHPAIYTPVKSLDINGENKVLLSAISNGINVISMHLNLDVASGGIDDCMAEGFGAKKYRKIDILEGDNGYGKEFDFNGTLKDVENLIKENFHSKRFLTYGNSFDKVEKIATFCGGGSGFAVDYLRKGLINADLIITADMPHHIIKELVEDGKKIIIMTHYSCENYGFRNFYEKVVLAQDKNIDAYFFEDKKYL